jgi:hypothetical protein
MITHCAPHSLEEALELNETTGVCSARSSAAEPVALRVLVTSSQRLRIKPRSSAAVPACVRHDQPVEIDRGIMPAEKRGVVGRIFKLLARDHHNEIHDDDVTIVRAHQDSVGAPKKASKRSTDRAPDQIAKFARSAMRCQARQIDAHRPTIASAQSRRLRIPVRRLNWRQGMRRSYLPHPRRGVRWRCDFASGLRRATLSSPSSTSSSTFRAIETRYDRFARSFLVGVGPALAISQSTEDGLSSLHGRGGKRSATK